MARVATSSIEVQNKFSEFRNSGETYSEHTGALRTMYQFYSTQHDTPASDGPSTELANAAFTGCSTS